MVADADGAGDGVGDEGGCQHGGRMPQHRAVEAHELQHEHARPQRGEEQGAERRGHADGARIAVGSAVAAARGRQLERAAQHGARRRAHLQRARLHADRAAAQQRKAAAAQYPDRKASRDATARAQLVDDAFGGQGRGQAQQTIQPHGQRAEDRQRQQQPGKTGRKALREPRGQSEHDGRGAPAAPATRTNDARRESRPRAVRPSREGPSRRSLRASTRASPPVMLRMLAHPLHGTEPSCGRTGAAGGGCRTVALR